MDLTGRKILISGASGGIGKTVASRLSKLGARLVVTGRDATRLQDTFDNLYGNGHKKYILDLVENFSQIADFINSTAEDQKYSGFVHAAGVGETVPFRMVSIDVLQKHMDTHFYSFIEIMKSITKKRNFDEAGGSIVAISSIASVKGNKGQLAYAAAKAALDSSVRVLSNELGNRRIRINAVRPGLINAGMAIGWDREYLEKLSQAQILGIGEADDVANSVAFLLSDESRFITGTFIDLDGGTAYQ